MPRWKTTYTQSEREVEEKIIKKSSSSWAIKISLILLCILSVIFIWSVYKYKKISRQAKVASTQNDQLASSRGNPQEIVIKAGRLVLLPTDERPSIATINNVVQLQKNQPFYKDAQNGDFLLLYFQAKKAYIYRESQNIIVNVGPLSLEKEVVKPAVSSSTTSTP